MWDQHRIVGRSAWQCLWLAVTFSLVWASVASAQTASVMRVEEDWELVVSEPNSYSDAPQVACAMSPLGNVNGVYANFELNHHTLPEYAAGGLQLQVWNGASIVTHRSSPNEASLAQNGERITWTQAMAVNNGVLSFAVVRGSSLAWGAFGSQGELSLAVTTTLNDLSAYQPEVSVANSGIGFAGNRVQSLILTQVRRYLANGDVIVDNQTRPVFVKQ